MQTLTSCRPLLVLFSLLHFFSYAQTDSHLPGAQANYLVLSAKHHSPPPFTSVRITQGPTEQMHEGYAKWWQFEVRNNTAYDSPSLFTVRALIRGNLLGPITNHLFFERYIVRFPHNNECLEYRNKHTATALMPTWDAFDRHFIPRKAHGSRLQNGMPETCEFLGHVLTQHHSRTGAVWETWSDITLLTLDPELLIGTSRPFKDKEGHRLPQQPQRQNYTYIPFDESDYRVMIDAGVNLFTIQPQQEPWVRTQPVFYIRSSGGNPPLRYPADLYRANYLGPTMFMDEPAILMVGDTNIHRTLRYFSDAATVIEKRTRQTYESDGSYGSANLEKSLLKQGINLGDMNLRHYDFPSWETLYDTTYYQMRGGGAGLVHEGRYQVDSFDAAIAPFLGSKRRHTAAEVLQYHYAFLRGGTRVFNKFWGTAIYGQCDTNLSPLALTMAYDMGARYLWFWTSDHDHHVPWNEQMALVRHLRAHEKAHPRGSIIASPAKVDVAIAIPYGYFLSLDNLWWVRVMDKDGKNEASQKYKRLMKRALEAAHECMDQKLSFDITVDGGQSFNDYAKVIRVGDE